MIRNIGGEKTRRIGSKTAALTILWIVLLAAALAFVAFAGHI